jgi:hypothetical protein
LTALFTSVVLAAVVVSIPMPPVVALGGLSVIAAVFIVVRR